MKKNCLVICISIIGLFLDRPILRAQDVGATFCWHYNEIYGGHDYPYNQSIVTKNLPTVTSTKWEGMDQWWENMVEEVDYSGIDFIALLSRGTQPNQTKDLGTGDPKHIKTLVKFIKERNAKFKLCIFDDCPNSWQGSRNYNLYGKDLTKYELFDCGNPDNYKYIWDYNLKLAIENIPDTLRYKIDNRLVIFFWSVKSTWMINMDGNLSKILAHIKTQCQQTFGFVPYIIVFKTWFERDVSLTPASADAAHNWFSAAGGTSYTLWQHNNVKTGVCVPAFVKPSEPTNGVLEPGMGTADMGKRLKTGLDATVGAGARVTLVEGFTDAAEGAALWRSTDEGQHIYYNYANQRLNILRRYTKNPYPDNLKMEAEACDFFSDLTTGNSGGAFLDSGDLDVVKCTDALGGWNVTNTQANEWMEWKELPLLAKTKFQLRYKSSTAASITMSVDGTASSTINLPNTNNVWTTMDAGDYNNPANGHHTVRLTIINGTPDINYFTRNRVSDVTGLKSECNFGKTVNIYPNPLSTNNVFIDLTGFENSAFVQVKIMTLYGQTVYRKYLNNTNHLEINTLNVLKKSVYIISVESGQTKIAKKLIVN
jgi:hypothetical protein